MRITKEILDLECFLTDEEKLKYSKQMAEAFTNKCRAEDAMKSFSSQKKAEIQNLESAVNLLADKLNSGKEYRPIECMVEYNFDDKTKRWIRNDTQEIIKEDIITEEELQEELNLRNESERPAKKNKK
jgi:hypothetical protein